MKYLPLEVKNHAMNESINQSIETKVGENSNLLVGLNIKSDIEQNTIFFAGV